MNCPRTARRSRGFTLLEAMIAAVILGLGLSSVLAVTSQSMRMMADVRARSRSSEVLQRKLEDIRLLNWSQVQALPSTFTDPTDTARVYTGSISQSQYDSFNGSTTTLKLTLSVTWTNRSRTAQTNSITTLITQAGLNNYIQ